MAIAGSVLDHVAIGVEDIELSREWLESQGAVPLPVENAPGFRARQWLFSSGMRMEVLAPFRTQENDFLRRFIDRSGAGPHHVTFAVDDLVEAMAQAETAGFPILYSNLENPGWLEAFIHPRHACGVVLQLAQSPGWDLKSMNLAVPTADLARVNLEVQDLDRATRLYRDLLGGAVQQHGDTLVLSWPGTGSIALSEIESSDRPGRVSSLSLSGPEVTAGFHGALGVEFHIE